MGQLPDLNAAAVFVKVVDHGSFRGAARALGIPKSNVSRRVAELEQQLGARLLQRTTRRLGLTDAGTAYYRQASAALVTLQDAERAVAELQAEPRGTLRLSASVTFGILVLPPLLETFLARYPEVRVVVDLSDRQVDLVEEGFDLAIRAGLLSDSSLVVQRIPGALLRCFASPAYLERHGTPRTPEDLAHHECLLFGLKSPAIWRFQGASRPYEVSVQGRLMANNLLLLRDAAVAGRGIACLPTVLALDALEAGALRSLLDEFALPETPFHVVYPSARHISPKVRAFVELLRGRLQDVTERARAAIPTGSAQG